MSPQKKKLHNPKTHAPAVYIPCWLSQVPTSLLSNNAKMFYGRLAQWSNENGIVFRSLPQLSEEIGAPFTTLKRHLKELKDADLIGTYHPKSGGVNHYEFYHHKWMDEPIHGNLTFKADPGADMHLPQRRYAPTPGADVRHINKKEVVISRKEPKTPVDSPNTTPSNKLSPYKKDDRFMSFYSQYPRKEKPADAWKAFKSVKPDDDLLGRIIEDVKQRCLHHSQWSDRQYIPLPASYLRSAAYEGEIFNEEVQRQAKKKLAEEQAKKNLEAQNEAAKRRADKERKDHEDKHNDHLTMKSLEKNAPAASPSAAWNQMRKKMGLGGR